MTTINDFIESNIDVGFCVNLDTDDLSIAGQREVTRYLNEQHLPAPDYTFDWRIKTNRGSLPKRLASYSYKNFDERMDDSVKETIGYICDKYRAYKSVFFFKFDSGIFWNLGDFSDHDSCYWQSKSSMRSALNGSGRAYAVKIYEDEQMNRPWGRAIIITRVPDNDSLLCINAYPKGFQVTNVGRMLVKLAKMNDIDVGTKLIRALYDRSWKDNLWINGGNSSIVAPQKVLSSLSATQDTIDINHHIDMYNCMICKTRSGRIGLPNSVGLVCKTCYNTYVRNCKICGIYYLSKNKKVNSLPIDLCNRCINKIGKCDFCESAGILDHHRMISFLDTRSSIRYYLSYVPSIGVMCHKCCSALIDKFNELYMRKSMTVGARKISLHQYVVPSSSDIAERLHLRSAIDLAMTVVSNDGQTI